MARYTKSNSKIDPKKFLGKGGGDLAKRVGNNERKITLLKNILQAQKVDIGEKLKFGGGLEDSIQTITDSVTSISETLLKQQELDKGQEDDDRIANQQKKRNLKEKLVEGGKGIGEGIKNQAQKAIVPIQSAFDKIKEWLIKLFAAKAVMELLKWFGDPANQEKVSSIFRFIKDWWPSILTALLLFAGSMLGPGGIILAVSALVIGFIPKITNAIKSLLGFTQETNQAAAQGESEANKISKDKGEDPDMNPGDAPEPGTQAPIGMNQGGQVPGSGNKDTVPAMLTPGEFVMSKDAVNQWGMDTLAGMNAAAGGKNTGSPLAGFSEGGPVMNEETDRLAKRIDPLITGEPEQHTGVKGALLGGLDAITGGLFDFDGKSGGGLLSNVADTLGGMFGGQTNEEGDVDLKEAIADLQDRFNYSIYDKKGTQPNEPASSEGGGSGGSGLASFISTLSSVPFVGPKIVESGKDLISGVEGMIDARVLKIKQEMSGTPATVGDTAGVETPGTPPAPTTTVAYANAVSGGGGAAPPVAAGVGNKVPSFSVGKYASPHKIKVLGISR